MKLSFNEKDSLYKIFNTIDKIPNNNKELRISIHPNNAFYENIWWGKQLVDTLNTKQINYVFLSKSLKTTKYFDKLGVNYINVKGPIIVRISQKIYNFFFKAKDLHVDLLKKKNYFGYMIIIGEIIGISYIFYLFYSLISPNAQIYIKSSYSLEQIVYNFRYYPYNPNGSYDSKYITIPYHSGSFDVTYNTSFDVSNIQYLQNPSQGKIKIINAATRGYSLKNSTKLITDDGLIFRTKNWLNIPAGSPQQPSITYVDVEAMDVDNKNKVIGNRGNITDGTNLYIRNLQDSFYLKKIYAIAVGNFVGGTTQTDGTVEQKDIDLLSTNLKEYVNKNKFDLINKANQDKNIIILPFQDIISPQIISININGKVGDKLSKLEGTISSKVYFKYIVWDEFKKAINEYIKQRDSKVMKLAEIDRNSVIFYEKNVFNKTYIIPTKVDIVRGYDFHKDLNGIKEEIKSKVLGKSIHDAKNAILEYPEIDVAVVKVAPNWYENLPTLRSRIKIDIGE